MANRLKRVFSTVLCATVMLTMTAVPGSVFAQTDADTNEQPEATAQTENQVTTPETESGGVTQEPKQAADQSKEAAEAPAKTQKAAQPQASRNEAKAVTQAAIAPYKFSGVTISVTPADKRQGNTVTACKGTVQLKIVLVNSTGGTYDYLWYKKGRVRPVAYNSYFTPTSSGVYYGWANEQWDGDPLGKKTKEITVNLIDHNIEAIGVKQATCTEEGHEAYWKCKNCGKMFSNASATKEINAPVVIPKKPHSLTIHASNLDATCTTDGHREHWQCSTCNMLFTDKDGKNPTTTEQVIIPAHGLTHVDAKEATCTESGNIEHWQCSMESCGKLFSDQDGKNSVTLKYVTRDAEGHDLVKHEAKAPTCTDPGNIEYWTCSKCNKIFADADAKEEIENEDATIISKKGHTLTRHEAVEPTCTKDGHKIYWACENCGVLFADDDGLRTISEIEIIPATGHKFGEWTVKKPAAIGTDGLKERVCEKCGYTETAVIPALEASKTDLNNKTELAKKTAESKSAEEKTDNSAKTGDDSSIALYALLALLAAGGAAGTVYRRKTNE